MPSRPQSSRSRLVAALAGSLLLHAALLLVCSSIRQPTRRPITVIDSRVSYEGMPFGLIDWKQPLPAKGKAEEQIDWEVHVEQTPATPFRNDNGPGPMVVARAGVGGAKHEDGGSGGQPGKGDNPSFFRVPIAARRIVFALDRSLSMGLDGCFTRARAELVCCLDSLSGGTAFQVVLYNRAADTIPEGGAQLLKVDSEVLRDVKQALAGIRPEGGTDHEKAFELALGFDPEVIFLVTDADDLTPAQLRHITSVNRNRVIIHTIDVSRRLKAAGMLAELASQNGGMHIHAR